MNFKRKLDELKIAIDREMAIQFDAVIADASKKDKLIAEALSHAKKIALAGGKRVRGTLLCNSYSGLGGRDRKKILKAAAAIEFVHLFLLVHDDIIDRGDLRHGKETIHKLFAKKVQKNNSNEKSEHFGDSIAIIVGDMLHAVAQKIILETGFSSENLSRALLQLQKVIATTIIGQSQDIAIEQKGDASEKDVLKMYENKTARYTFEGPLHVGATLAGCSDRRTFDILSKYSVPLGIAFQIQDDILGVFGSQKKMGKSVASDIEEGKVSLMVVKAREAATSQQKNHLNSILGKKNLTKKEIREFQNILKSTGALEYCRKLASGYIQRAKLELEKIIIKKDAKVFLIGLAEYLEAREV
ncbi:MAG: hypothetical protein ACD_9C00211G0007 [uncultured bacterium]|nr:MAG: hypothetical protein ACD_9C00211G0007 [uncultured bacterium]